MSTQSRRRLAEASVVLIMGAILSALRHWLGNHLPAFRLAETPTVAAPPREPEDIVAHCLAKIQASTTDGDAELDQRIVPGVVITALAPAATGFPAWSRSEDNIATDADKDRGHADWVVPEGADNASPRILYLHGGGYEYYSPQDVYRPTTSRLAAATGMPVLAIDYRLCPEFRHPAQLDDAVQGFEWLAANGPFGPGRAPAVFLAGDSAGGGLCLALAVRLRDQPIAGAAVAGVAVVSPQTDMTCSGESYTSRRWREGECSGPRDPIFTGEDPSADSMPQIYKLLGEPGEPGSYALDDPSISPLHAELHGLPPVQIHVGDAEVMLSDAVEFQKKAAAAGSDARVTVWPRMWHVFTQYSEGCGGADAWPLREALEAQRQQADFLKELASACRQDPADTATPA